MRNFLLVIILLISVQVSAQTDKGTIMAGGQLAFTTNKNASSFRLNPNFGYFVGDNLAVGGNVRFDFSKAGTVSANEFGIGPFMRYYFGKAETKPFLVVSADYLTNTVKTDVTKISNSGFGFLTGLGFAAFLNRNVGVEGIAGYNYAKYTNADGNGGFSLSLGFQLYFNKDVVRDLKRTVTGD
jgi:outer membrane protein W